MSDHDHHGALVTSDQPPDFSRQDLALLDDVSSAFDQSPAGMSMEAVEAELAQIAEIRQRNRRAYFKDERLQARERELLAVKEIGFLDVAPELLEDWRNSGGIALRLKMAREAVAIALESLGYPDQQDLVQSFEQLPRNAQTQIYRFIALDPSKSVRPVSSAVLAKFKETVVGTTLCKEWGGEAAHKLAQVQTTIAMMSRRVSKADDQAARDWFDTLPASQQKACLRALAR